MADAVLRPEAAAACCRSWGGRGHLYLQRHTQQPCSFLLIQLSLKTQEPHLLLGGLKTAGRADGAVRVQLLDEDLFRKGLPLQQSHFLPCYIHLQHSAGEKGGCLSSAKTDIWWIFWEQFPCRFVMTVVCLFCGWTESPGRSYPDSLRIRVRSKYTTNTERSAWPATLNCCHGIAAWVVLSICC